jgi:RNA polymerase sigma-70 factor (ECF subfamily)
MDDADLVRQVRQHNTGAYGELVKRYTAQVAALCRAHHLPAQAVEDLVQETFTRGLESLAELREPEKFGCWLYAIARNLCRSWHNENGPQARARREQQEGDRQKTQKREDNGQRGRAEHLKECLSRLPIELREVIELYYGADRITYQELADRLGIAYATVNKRLTEARRRLRTCLERTESHPSLPT